MSSGIKKAWQVLDDLNPDDVCKNTSVSYNRADGAYVIRSLGMEFSVSLKTKEIKAHDEQGDAILKKLGYFISHSILWYLIGAHDIPASGRLIKPSDVKGGHLFFRGTHELPLEGLAGKYKSDREGFLSKADGLGGRELKNYGDASVELLPLPRVPVTLILWLSDEEFPARADILLDSTIERHLPLDIIWSVSMLSVLAVM